MRDTVALLGRNDSMHAVGKARNKGGRRRGAREEKESGVWIVEWSERSIL